MTVRTYHLRLPTRADIEPILLPSTSHRDDDLVLMAFAHYEQEGGHAADGVILLAMARTPEQLVHRMAPHVRIDEGTPGKPRVQVLVTPSMSAYAGSCEVDSYGPSVFKGHGEDCELKVVRGHPQDFAGLDLGRDLPNLAAEAAQSAPGFGR